MFYRVDYILALLLAGFIIGLLVSARAAGITATHVARRYYAAVAVVLVLRTITFVGSLLIQHQSLWTLLSGLTGDVTKLLFGFIFGLALRRPDARAFLVDRSVLDALRMPLALTFALAAIGKMFSMGPMTEFFAQSGYSITFLKFIITAEVIGSLGLLLPWATVPAIIGLSIDMFGAVVTHVHNGDALNDSTGAIALLIWLVAVGVLWTLRRQAVEKGLLVLRGPMLRVAAVFIVCLFIAIAGSTVVRHLNAPPDSLPASPASR